MANTKMMDNGRKVSLYLNEELIEGAKLIARRNKISFSAFVRDCLRKEVRDTITIQLEVTPSAHDALKRRAENTGFTVPGLIKRAIQEKFKHDS